MAKGDRIKARREELGMTQVALADMIGESKQNIYKYENNIITNIPSDEVTSSNLVSSSMENTRKPAKTKGLRVFLCWFLLSDFCAEKL